MYVAGKERRKKKNSNNTKKKNPWKMTLKTFAAGNVTAVFCIDLEMSTRAKNCGSWQGQKKHTANCQTSTNWHHYLRRFREGVGERVRGASWAVVWNPRRDYGINRPNMYFFFVRPNPRNGNLTQVGSRSSPGSWELLGIFKSLFVFCAPPENQTVASAPRKNPTIGGEEGGRGAEAARRNV